MKETGRSQDGDQSEPMGYPCEHEQGPVGGRTRSGPDSGIQEDKISTMVGSEPF